MILYICRLKAQVCETTFPATPPMSRDKLIRVCRHDIDWSHTNSFNELVCSVELQMLNNIYELQLLVATSTVCF